MQINFIVLSEYYEMSMQICWAKECGVSISVDRNILDGYGPMAIDVTLNLTDNDCSCSSCSLFHRYRNSRECVCVCAESVWAHENCAHGNGYVWDKKAS